MKKKEKKNKEKKYLRINDIIDLLCVSRTTLWKIRQNPDFNFPPGKFISKQVKIWSKKDIEKWLENEEKN